MGNSLFGFTIKYIIGTKTIEKKKIKSIVDIDFLKNRIKYIICTFDHAIPIVIEQTVGIKKLQY